MPRSKAQKVFSTKSQKKISQLDEGDADQCTRNIQNTKKLDMKKNSPEHIIVKIVSI